LPTTHLPVDTESAVEGSQKSKCKEKGIYFFSIVRDELKGVLSYFMSSLEDLVSLNGEVSNGMLLTYSCMTHHCSDDRLQGTK